MRVVESTFLLPRERFEEALRLMQRQDLQNLASLGWEDMRRLWKVGWNNRKWRNEEFGIRRGMDLSEALKCVTTLQAFLALLDWQPRYDNQGNIIALDFLGKYQQIYTFVYLERIASLVNGKLVIEWGEKGAEKQCTYQFSEGAMLRSGDCLEGLTSTRTPKYTHDQAACLIPV
jgi:hypothetical protein